jgi:hypothetical protein
VVYYKCRDKQEDADGYFSKPEETILKESNDAKQYLTGRRTKRNLSVGSPC